MSVFAIVFGTVSLTVAPGKIGGNGYHPALTTPGWLSRLRYVALFSFGLVPVAIGFAVLRYRLFEIDVIIQKTPVYATLVAILATLYLSGIAGLGWIARTAMGRSGAVAVTLSTPAVALTTSGHRGIDHASQPRQPVAAADRARPPPRRAFVRQTLAAA